MTKLEAKQLLQKGEDIVIEHLVAHTKKISILESKIDRMKIKIAQLKKNSRNSSKKPSSDDITKPPQGKVTDDKKTDDKKKKIGGQLGHPKYTRPPYAKKDVKHFHEHILLLCPECHGEGIPTGGDPEITQQIEIPAQPTIIHEHQGHPLYCPTCDKIHYATPVNIKKEGLFKPRITALVCYLKHVCHASFSTIRKYFRDVLQEKISRGYLRKIIQKVSTALDRPYSELLNAIPLEKTLNVDETGHKENGKRFWTWVFKADLFVLFHINQSRGSKVLIDIIGEDFDGVIGCDYFSAYRKYMKDFDVTLQFCIAHLIRDIKFLQGLPDKESKDYGERILNKVKTMFGIIHDRENLSEATFLKKMNNIKAQIIEESQKNVPSELDKAGKELRNHAQNMALRFRKNGQSYFNFITTPNIGPTNNDAERAVRFIVIDRYVTQGTRSEKGRKSCERIWSVIATCKLQGKSAFEFIRKAIEAYFLEKAPPSLLLNSI